jgi:hypothetical protein
MDSWTTRYWQINLCLLDLNRRKHEEFIITWIHLFLDHPPRYEQFHGNYKYTDTITLQDLEEILYIESEKKHIVVLDGYSNINRHRDIRLCCSYWYSHNKSNGRLVTISTMESRGKTKIDDDIVLNVKSMRRQLTTRHSLNRLRIVSIPP